LGAVPLAACGADSSASSGLLPEVLENPTFQGPYQTMIALQTSDRLFSVPVLLTSNGVGSIQGSSPVDLTGMTPTPSSSTELDLNYENRGGHEMTLFGQVDGVFRHPFAQGAVSQDARVVAWSHSLTTDIIPPGVWYGVRRESNAREATLQGDYHFVSMSVDTSLPLDRGRIGRWTFDGLGGLTVSNEITNDAGLIGIPAASPYVYSYGVPNGGLVTLTDVHRIWLGSVLGDGSLGVFTAFATGPSSGVFLSLALCLPEAPSATTATVNGTYHFIGFSFDGTDFTSNFGTVDTDGLGNLTGTVMDNKAGYTSPPMNIAATYLVGANGAFRLTTPGGDKFQGGVSASGDLVIMGGGVTAGTERGLWLLFR
jgi:hypothetical protein